MFQDCICQGDQQFYKCPQCCTYHGSQMVVLVSPHPIESYQHNNPSLVVVQHSENIDVFYLGYKWLPSTLFRCQLFVCQSTISSSQTQALLLDTFQRNSFCQTYQVRCKYRQHQTFFPQDNPYLCHVKGMEILPLPLNLVSREKYNNS